MNIFFVCFGAKDKVDFQTDPFATAITSKEAKVSRNQLSDLFLTQELEEVSCHEKNTKPEFVYIQCCNDEKIADSDKQLDKTWTPAKTSELEKVLDCQEETIARCISDPQSPLTNSVSTNEKSKKGVISDTNEKIKSGSALSQKEMRIHRSKSSLLNPVPHSKADGRIDRSPRDRPILRPVTAQLNQEVDPCRIPLKWWDGNGIPNSTNKYREDQIVSWDGTPFEERLEKALSEANSISKSRKHISGACDTFEDENDTAASQLKSLPHQKSLVSF